MMASESCSTSSSSSGDDFAPIFFFFLLRKVISVVMKSLRRSYDKKRSTIRWMKQTQQQLKLSPVKTKAIHADLDLCPSASPVGNTFWCQWGECFFARDRSKTGLRLLFWLCRAGGESSLSIERLHVVYICRGRLATVCTHFPSVNCSGRRWEIFWTWLSAL